MNISSRALPTFFLMSFVIFVDGTTGDKLTGKCFYFIRDTNKPVRADIACSNELICGELSANILDTYDNVLTKVFSPLLAGQEEWGHITRENEKQQFISQISKFHSDLNKKIQNLRGDLQLQGPKAPYDRIEPKPPAYTVASRDPVCLQQFCGIVDSWCTSIQTYMDNDVSTKPLDPLCDEGPEVEIEYWSRRMLTLISVTEQLKAKSNRVVTGVLKVRTYANPAEETKSESAVGIRREDVKVLLDRWKDVDLAITDSLNEAKDNVRFLDNLQKVIEPLYTETPQVLIDNIPALLNSMKMIHTLSRHYGTEVRMTNLFQRLTNQLIARCKHDIYSGGDVNSLWSQSPDVVITKMHASINLSERYHAAYIDTAKELAQMANGKQFDFDEGVIFGKFTRFRRRLEKLIDMFSSIKQFRALENKRIDGMEGLIRDFYGLIQRFREKNHDLLDFTNTIFERDFVEFTMHNSGLENAIKDFMESSIAQISSIDKQLEQMRKFKEVLHREALREELDSMFSTIFRNYSASLETIAATFEKHYKDIPPIARNMTKIAGCIQWSRQLLRRVTSPMRKFQENPKVFQSKEVRAVVQTKFNRLCNQLIEYESIWFQAWQRSTEQVKKGLRSRLITEDANGQLVVNFDQGVLVLMREARYLQVMGFEIPNSAKMVLLLEDKLRSYYAQISHLLSVYHRVVGMISPVTRTLLRPHLADLERLIAPAAKDMSWTSMNIEQFLNNLRQVLSRFEHLVLQVNDTMANRIEKNFHFIANSLLVNLPPSQTFSTKSFIADQTKHIEAQTMVIAAKNVEVERAVGDVIDAVTSYPLSESIERPFKSDTNFLRFLFCSRMYHALLLCTQRSLTYLRDRVTTVSPADNKPETLAGLADQALFEVDVSLHGQVVTMSPSMQDIHDVVYTVARAIITSVGKVKDWGLDGQANDRPARPFFERLAADKTVAIVLLLLRGAVEDTKHQARQRLQAYSSYEWLWQSKFDDDYAAFKAKPGPVSLDAYVARLQAFVDLESTIASLPPVTPLGAFNLKVDNLKNHLRDACFNWRRQYAERLHEEAKASMDKLTNEMTLIKRGFESELADFSELGPVMEAQRAVREKQSSIEMQFTSLFDMYEVVERYLPPSSIPKGEMDAKSVLRTNWARILRTSESMQDKVLSLQDGFKEDLLLKIEQFKHTAEAFRVDYETNGPKMQRITPAEAMGRVNKYKRESDAHARNREVYNTGERLFGLPVSQYPALTAIAKEVKDLESLYQLYEEVIRAVDKYKNIAWADVMANFKQMDDEINSLRNRCARLPKSLKEKREDEWTAYSELSTELDNLTTVLPLLTELSKPSMRQRHWDSISKLTGTDFNMERFADLKLKQVLEANLLAYKDDIVDITSVAEKQLSIENKLAQIRSMWEGQTFEFSTWKARGDVILNGSNVTTVVEQLEESQSSLTQMLTQRQGAPFKEEVSAWLEKLSSVNDVLDQWIKVQQLWMSLEAVFLQGDISRQLPADTRTFVKWDKEWCTRLMNKAKEVRNVVECCQNEYIRDILPTMTADLEKCQKALDGYLEAKRGKFPRFYFVSNPALLQILSQGSDKEKVQSCFSKVFDSIDRVEFQGNNITKMRSLMSGKDGKMEQEEIVLSKPVHTKGNIEEWLLVLLKQMQVTMKDKVRIAAAEFDMMKSAPEKTVPEFINAHCAQVALLGIQFLWTSQCTEAIMRYKPKGRDTMRDLKDQSEAVVAALSQLTLDATKINTKMDRTKIETLITIQVHQRDVIATDLVSGRKNRRRDVTDFEWQRQLRCYWSVDDDNAVVKIADVDFTYCYEYLGCKERLVITSLTDRCYISLSQALSMGFGGAPAGPAGTGKTETTKDLGRALGTLVVVMNCSDQLHTKDTQKLFKGICQSGVWGCFDEFNRIDLEVLSVVAQQVQTIFNGIRAQVNVVYFPADEPSEKQSAMQATVPVALNHDCGIFITMNPGYAGRQELPENLKALFRSVAMMVPESSMIIKVKLSSVGYMEYEQLSKKFYFLYKLCEQQLSKQRHYDFGLRNILSVLRTAGDNLRYELEKDKIRGTPSPRDRLEEMIIMRTLRDMNLSKFVSFDVALFLMLLSDLFPSQKEPEKRVHEELEPALKIQIEEHKPKILAHADWVTKCIQLYETSLVRHGLMMIGPAGSGKSMATKMLLDAMTAINIKTNQVRMNPKAITAEQMFGYMDKISGEWTDGVFSKLWEKYNDIKKNNTWLVCDGPVDAIWIENLNTVLDDNKILTLASGDRLPMTGNVRLLFEAEDLRNASPATVSRAGIIFVSHTDLGWRPVFEAWLLARSGQRKVITRDGVQVDEIEIIRESFTHYVTETNLLEEIRRTLRNVVSTADVHLITNLATILEALLKDVTAPLDADSVTRYFIYALCWSLGGLLEEEHRSILNRRIIDLTDRSLLPKMVDKQTLWDFYVNPETHQWKIWEVVQWRSEGMFKFTSCLIPTADSLRAEYVISILQNKLRRPVLLTGSPGTAKTSVVQQYARSFEQPSGLVTTILKKINFSSATTHNMFQKSMEADLEKGIGKVLNPSYGRWMMVFLDDISMPEANAWGDQPTLEIVRQLIESGGFYSLDKDKRGDKMQIERVLYTAAMTHPGGGRNDIPNRLKRHFFMFNMLPPSNLTIDNIYGAMLQQHFAGESYRPIKDVITNVTVMTVDLWSKVRAKMLPTPSRFHYIFNMRDLSRIFQGILHAPVEIYQGYRGQDMLILFIHLWRHECERVLSDKLTNYTDKQWVSDHMATIIASRLGGEIAQHFPAVQVNSERKDKDQHGSTSRADSSPKFNFVNFLRDAKVDEETDEILEEAPLIYEPAPPLPQLRARMQMFLDNYNGVAQKPMNLVLFEDALEHVVRISRIIGLPRGSALLIGVGGSGRQSLTRLAASIARHDVFQLQLTANYKINDFLEDIRRMQIAVGKDGKRMTWILTDFEIVDEQFLEYVNALLATGEIAGLFTKDERDIMCADMRGPAMKENPKYVDTPDNNYRYFVDRVRDNLHIVMCFSPANEKFAERARRFPGVINNCTIDWFLRWPEQALRDVSNRFLTDDPNFKVTATPDVEQRLGGFIASVHTTVTSACEEYFQKFRRQVYVTPKSYLSYIQTFKEIYQLKHAEITLQSDNVINGLQRLREAENDVEGLKLELHRKNEELEVANKACNDKLEELKVGAAEARRKKEVADAIEQKSLETANNLDKEKAIAYAELEKSRPFVEAAEKAAQGINPQDLNMLSSFKNPPLMIKLIMDCVLILTQKPLVPVSMTYIELKKGEPPIEFISDSFDTYSKKLMSDPSFIKSLQTFLDTEKDKINDETMEFLEPYLTLDGFDPARAKNASNSAESLCNWCIALSSYHVSSLVMIPKLQNLQAKEGLLHNALKHLATAKESSAQAQAIVDRLQSDFEATLETKKMLEEDTERTKAKMSAANSLIQSLGGEKRRWGNDAQSFAESKRRLVGDCALACAFVSYLGPFNYQFRQRLLYETFFKQCNDERIPFSQDIKLTSFLVDDSTIANWNQEGLPKDDLSIQNGILVTKASRYPLLIDPQDQAVTWVKEREKNNLPAGFDTTTVNHKAIRQQLEDAMENGNVLIVEGVVKDLDPMFDMILDKNVITRGRNRFIAVGERLLPFSESFRLYLITKLPNPLFSPELSAKTTIIDFSVTQKGLEDQLLSKVIIEEQKSLEDQRKQLIEAVNENTIALQDLDKLLLDRLSSSAGGRLLDDTELISVLSNTKMAAQEVQEKIEASKKTEEVINKKREQYRPVATRGSVLYFVVVALTQINCMYQNSLDQFDKWFHHSLKTAEQANNQLKRVENLKEHLTLNVYRQINQGLFEVDKLTFKLMIALRIMQAEGDGASTLTDSMVQLLLHGTTGSGNEQMPKRPEWLPGSAWQSVVNVAQSVPMLVDLRSLVESADREWRTWYESDTPESSPEVPRLTDRFTSNGSMGAFMKLLIVRCFRPDRMRLASTEFVQRVLGEEFVQPINMSFDELFVNSSNITPVILLLTPGADPTSQLEDLAKRNAVKIHSVSMGEGQEDPAYKAMKTSMETGAWTLLQNCHLGLGFMARVESIIADQLDADSDSPNYKPLHPNFRLWITCEPHRHFPISLLQISIKVTNEPPRGMKAGMLRSFQAVVDSKLLTSIESKDWRDAIFATCFLHSAVQERRKFGPIGWCIAYEFSTADLEASLKFLEKHFFANPTISWETIKFMICQVQYGGRITDDYDRRLFATLGDHWLTPEGSLLESFEKLDRLLRPEKERYERERLEAKSEKADKDSQDRVEKPSLQIAPVCRAVQCETHSDYLWFISLFQSNDSPDTFGLHPNADLTFGDTEARYIFDAIADTMPKQVGGATSGVRAKTREEQVYEKAEELLHILPEAYSDDTVTDRVRTRRMIEVNAAPSSEGKPPADTKSADYWVDCKDDGFSVPLNMFLYQEINRLNATIKLVRKTLLDLKAAIAGEIIMTPALEAALHAVYQMRPPSMWYLDASGAEIAWIAPSLSTWFNGLRLREDQLSVWLHHMRPYSYWLTGFYNPQGFLTATQQEITRRNIKNFPGSSPLDEVVVKIIVTDAPLSKCNEPGAYIFPVPNPPASASPAAHAVYQQYSQHPRIMPKQKVSADVYIHGLYLEGAGFGASSDRESKDSKAVRVLKESAPREVYTLMPMMQVTAVPHADEAKESKDKYYECPLYTKKRRTGQNFVVMVKLRTDSPPKHWAMRGVALLCTQD